MAAMATDDISTVFLIGLVKLWQNNRELRKYEVIDEERRSRITEMKHCGIRHMSYSNVPFGVRAIERGVEVEGIWIAGSRPAEASQTASSAPSAIEGSKQAVPGGEKVYYCLEDAQESVGESSNAAFTRSSALSAPDAHHVAEYSDYAVEHNEENHGQAQAEVEGSIAGLECCQQPAEHETGVRLCPGIREQDASQAELWV
ncbi:hypothetical protein MHUMG1_06822 [Metarhizium humberi]|uniref:Uncharacterized protein n=1 Tax=Metarhizium humberi TaxID=2596975 RepID=A0A9P8MBN8_9HYPO|nr:hypothetical protein MHUMG1_06822 [Metarhizium humberi]